MVLFKTCDHELKFLHTFENKFNISQISRYECRYNVSRRSHPRMLYKIGALKNFPKFIGKHFSWSIFLIKLHALQAFFTELLWNASGYYILFSKPQEHLTDTIYSSTEFRLLKPFEMIVKQPYFRRSHQRCSIKRDVLRNFAKCFHVNFAKFIRTSFLQNTSEGCI